MNNRFDNVRRALGYGHDRAEIDLNKIQMELARLRKIEEVTRKIYRHYTETDQSEENFQIAKLLFNELTKALDGK
jgi:hypothetical protein